MSAIRRKLRIGSCLSNKTSKYKHNDTMYEQNVQVLEYGILAYFLFSLSTVNPLLKRPHKKD